MKRPDTIVPVNFTPPEGMVFFQIPHVLAVADPSRPETREMQILPLGRLTTVDGRELEVTVEDLTLVKMDLATRTNDLPVLYEHAQGPRGGLAAGWIPLASMQTLSRLDSSPGLFGMPDYTELAAGEIKADGWRFVSPGFFGVWDEEDVLHPRILIEASLTNVPAIDGMRRVAASIGIPTSDGVSVENASAKLPATATVPTLAHTPGNADEPEETETMNEEAIKALIAESLKPVEARAEKLATENTGLKALVTELEAKVAKMPEETRSTVASFQTEAETERKLAALLERATKAGLVTDDTRESFTALAKANLDATEKVVARAEAVTRAPRGGLYRPGTPSEALSADAPARSKSERLNDAVREAAFTGVRVRDVIREVAE